MSHLVEKSLPYAINAAEAATGGREWASALAHYTMTATALDAAHDALEALPQGSQSYDVLNSSAAALAGARGAAEAVLMDTPAPDLSAFIRKLEVAARRLGFADLTGPEGVEWTVIDSEEGRTVVALYLDAIRLGGSPNEGRAAELSHRVRQAQRFAPSAWLAGFDTVGGTVEVGRGRWVFVTGTPEAIAMAAGLSDWERAKVLQHLDAKQHLS